MKQAKTLNSKELKRVLGVIRIHAHAARNEALVLFSFWAGLRAKELAELRKSDVYEVDGTVRRTVMLCAEQTKGQCGRTVRVNSRLAKALAVYAAVVEKNSPESPLFVSQKGGAFSANTMCQLLCDLYGKAGISGASSHSGRRSFITNLASKGVGARVLMELARHSNLATTQRYIDVNDKMLADAVELA